LDVKAVAVFYKVGIREMIKRWQRLKKPSLI